MLDHDKAVCDNKALLQLVSLYDFDRYNTLKKAYFAGDDYDTAQFSFIILLGISAESDVKEVAWDFIKQVLTSAVSEEETKNYDYNSVFENAEFVPEVGNVLAPASFA